MQPQRVRIREADRQGTISVAPLGSLQCRSVRLCLALPIFLSLLAACGCASFELPSLNLEKYLPMMTGRTGEFRRPLKMVAFWTDTVRTAEGQPAMRGFGGRLMFYDGKSGRPLKVAGTLVIYAFDESHATRDNPRPDRKFVFTTEQFPKHYSKSDLGHSYSFWLPWDPVGGATKEVDLICRFTPVEGGAIVSEQVRQLLPGVERSSPAPALATGAVATPVNLVNYEITSEEAVRGRMATTTIDLQGPPNRRLPTALSRPRSSFPPHTADGTMPMGSMTPARPITPTGSLNGTNPGGPTTPMGAPSVSAPAGQNPTNPAGAPASQQGVATTVRATQAPNGSWLAHFGPHRSRAPGAPIAPPDRARGPWRPTHVVPSSFPATTPTSGQAP